MRRSRAGSAATCLSCVLLAATPALGLEANRCGEDNAPWIRIEADGLTAELRAVIVGHIRSSLSARDLDVCVSEQKSAAKAEPLATLRVMPLAEEVATSLVVNDGVTHKRVERDLDLRGIPPDVRPLTIALALDELLRASWAELLLATAHPRTPAPEVVTRAIQAEPVVTPPSPSPSPALPDRWEVGAAMGFEHFGGGQDQVGADALGTYSAARWLGFHARAGARDGFSVRAPRGGIDSTALAFALGLRFPLVRDAGRIGADAFAEGILTRVAFVATAVATSTRGNERTVTAAYAAVGARGWVRLVSRLRGFVHAGVGTPLRTADATDGALRVTGLSGVLFLGGAGISATF